MNKWSIGLGIILLISVSGCSNVRFVEPRTDCQRNLMLLIPWDGCGEKGDAVIPNRKMRGEVRDVSYEEPVDMESGSVEMNATEADGMATEQAEPPADSVSIE